VAIGEVATRDYLRGELDRLRVDLDEMTNPDSADKPAKRPPDKRLKGRSKTPAKAQATSGRSKSGGGPNATTSGSGSLTIDAGPIDPIPGDPPPNGGPSHGQDDGVNPN